MRKKILALIFVLIIILLNGCRKAEEVIPTVEPEGLTEVVIEAVPEVLPETPEVEKEYEIEEFMQSHDVELLAHDVKENMTDNLDKSFALEGKLQIDGYYDYGFTIDMRDEYFCGLLEDNSKDNKESWYLYFDMEDFKEVLRVIEGQKTDVQVIAYIPKERFIQGQGNLAEVKAVKILDTNDEFASYKNKYINKAESSDIRAEIEELVINYTEGVAIAVNNNDISHVSPYLIYDSFLYNDQMRNIKNANNKGIKEEWLGTKILDVKYDQENNIFKVKVYEEYELFYADGTNKEVDFYWIYSLKLEPIKGIFNIERADENTQISF